MGSEVASFIVVAPKKMIKVKSQYGGALFDKIITAECCSIKVKSQYLLLTSENSRRTNMRGKSNFS